MTFRYRFWLPTLVLLGLAGVAQALPLIVQTRSGPVRGAGSDVMSFKGIPYAAAPVGDLRWRAPVPPASWREPRDATHYGPRCPQPASVIAGAGLLAGPGPDPSLTGQPAMSEDCLTLNIWSPAGTANERLPVVLWVHGGGFQFGSGSVPETDGTALARRGVVLVSLNYRLGALGFLAHPQLSRESPQRVSGNYGLLDQVQALHWIHDNIAAFGGDPGNVTFMGQSAGGYSGAVLMMSPLTKGLIHRVVAMSPAVVFGGPRQRLRETYYGLPSAESQGARLVPDIAALRSVPAEQLIEQLHSDPTLSSGVHLVPIIDGYVEPDDASLRIGTRAQPAIPVLVGYAAAEGLFFRADAPRNLRDYRRFLASRYAPDMVAEVEAAYPAHDDVSAAAAVTRMFGESDVLTTAVLMARNASRRAPAYLFRFARISPFIRATWGDATHTADRLYWFDNVTNDASRYELRDRELANEMSAALVRFATTGNPNDRSLPGWPQYRQAEGQVLEFGDRTRVLTGSDGDAVRLFERVWQATRHTNLLPD